MTPLIQLIGWTLHIAPRGLVNAIIAGVATVVYYGMPKRRRVIESNLSHCFPEKTDSWRKQVTQGTLRRMVEMGLFVVVSPFWGSATIRKNIQLSDPFKQMLKTMAHDSRPLVGLVPHFCLMEMITLAGAVSEEPLSPSGVIYRPFGSAAIERWVKNSREKFGMELLSRKGGFARAQELLRQGNTVAVLFDQNAGTTGELTTFFGRLASTASLPFLWVHKYSSHCHMVFTRRKGLWRAELDSEVLDIPKDIDATEIMLLANQWLENKLRSDPSLCKEWLWAHKRWNTQNDLHLRLRIEMKRNCLERTKEFYGWDALPKKERFFIRMPNWLGDVVMAIPLIKAIAEGRPDAELTLLAQPHFIGMLQKLGVGDAYIAIPPKGRGYYSFFRKLKRSYPDTWICFTNSLRGDIEAWLSGCPMRFGIERGKKRRLLSASWQLPASLNEKEIHQTHLWEKYLQRFGLQQKLCLDPLSKRTQRLNRIGLISGTENSPEKRWPVKYWINLIDKLQKRFPEHEIVLYGTANDAAITQKISRNCTGVIDMAGKTDLSAYMDALAGCRLVICNDTGGMHLSNALGIPTVTIFGPTNPVRTGPIFKTPHINVQPEGAPETGGGAIEDVTVSQALEASERLLTQA